MGSLFGSPLANDPSLFNGMLAPPSSALATLAASRGTEAPMPVSVGALSGGGNLPALASPPPPQPAAPDQANTYQPAAPSQGTGAPDPNQMVQYAQELGIPIAQKHKFNVGRALVAFFNSAPAAMAVMRGDYGAAATLNAHQSALTAQLRNSQQKAALEQTHQLSIYAAMRSSGMSQNQATLAMSNLDEFGKNFNTRFRTDNMSEGQTRYQPGLNGTDTTFTTPKLVQHGADYQYVTPPTGINSSAGDPPLDGNTPAMQSIIGPGAAAGQNRPAIPMLPGGGGSSTVTLGPSGRQISLPNSDTPDTSAAPARPTLPRMPLGAPMMGAAPLANVVGAGSLRTDAEQYADTLYQRGTPQWRSAVQDAMLKANGPTAFGQDQVLQGQRLGVQMRGQDIDQGNNIRTNDTSSANNVRSTNASMSNNRNRPAAVGVDPTGHTVIVYPDNRVVQTTGIRPVSSAARRGRQGGGAGGSSEGAVAVGPGGHKIVVRGGRWVDAQTGQPVG